MHDLSRREFLKAGGVLVAGVSAAGALPPAPAAASKTLRKMIDIGPAGVIYPGSAQDYRFHGNRHYLADTGTPWIRMWADWPSLQPDGAYAPDDPASPGFWRLQALDEQIIAANADGVKVMLMPYRFPTWANGTAALSARKDSDDEISFQYWDRMTSASWNRYVRNGRDPSLYNPSRRALEYRLPPDAYGPASAWARFFEFLYRRYHYGRRARGRFVDGFELVNEPNLQLWPQQAPAATGADPFTPAAVTITHVVAQLMQTAQAIAGRLGNTTMLFAPSISDSDTASSRRYTRYDAFVGALLDAFGPIGYSPTQRMRWAHHNYTDVEKRQTATRTQVIRGLLAGRWTGWAAYGAPNVFVTEGGARLSRMPALYPAEEPRQAQAKCIADALARHAVNRGAGAGVEMLAQYLLYADPNFDCGLLDPYPSTVKRPAYDAWKAFPSA